MRLIRKNRTLQTNAITKTSPQAEEVDSIKLEETFELMSQLPVKARENTNKENETVEGSIDNVLKKLIKSSGIVSESQEQCAEETD